MPRAGVGGKGQKGMSLLKVCDFWAVMKYSRSDYVKLAQHSEYSKNTELYIFNGLPVWYTKQPGFTIWLLLICEFAYSPRCICYHRINACSAYGHLQTWTVLWKIWVIRWTCCQLRSNTVMLCLLVSAFIL